MIGAIGPSRMIGPMITPHEQAGDGQAYVRLNDQISDVAHAFMIHNERARAWALRGLVDGWALGKPRADLPRAFERYYLDAFAVGLAADWHACEHARTHESGPTNDAAALGKAMGAT